MQKTQIHTHTFIKVELWLMRYKEGKELSARIFVGSIIKTSASHIILTKMGTWKAVKVKGILTHKIMPFQGTSDPQGIFKNPVGLSRLHQRWEA